MLEQANDGGVDVMSSAADRRSDFEEERNAGPSVPCWHVHRWETQRWRRASFLKLALLVLICVAIILFVVYGKTEWIADFGKWSEKHRVEGAFGLAGIYCLAAVCLIPAALLTVVAGFILGLPVGCCAVIIGATMGSCLAFFNGRFLFKEMVDEYLVKKYPQMQALARVIRKNQFKVVMLLRLSPIVPYNALNYCLGIMPLDFFPYMMGSFLGMMPGTLLYVYIGSTAASITDVASGNIKQTPLQQALFWVGLGLTVLLTVAVTILARRELGKELEKDSAEASQDLEIPAQSRVEVASSAGVRVEVAGTPNAQGPTVVPAAPR